MASRSWGRRSELAEGMPSNAPGKALRQAKLPTLQRRNHDCNRSRPCKVAPSFHYVLPRGEADPIYGDINPFKGGRYQPHEKIRSMIPQLQLLNQQRLWESFTAIAGCYADRKWQIRFLRGSA